MAANASQAVKPASTETAKTVETLASYGIPNKEIAKVVGLTEKQLAKSYGDIISVAHAKANAMVAQNLFNKATKGQGSDAVTAAIYWLKTRAEHKAEEEDQPRKMGRPSSYSEEMADRILEHIASGRALTEHRQAGLPNPTTIFRWLESNEDFRNKYAHAREKQAEVLAAQIITIADTEPDAQKARNRIDARKWVAAKLLPKVYGDNQKVEVNHNIKIAEEHAAALLELSRRKREADGNLIDVTPDPSPIKGASSVIDQQVMKMLPRAEDDEG